MNYVAQTVIRAPETCPWCNYSVLSTTSEFNPKTDKRKSKKLPQLSTNMCDYRICIEYITYVLYL